MAFWNEPGMDPKRAFRFKVEFSGLGGTNNESVYLAQTAKRPTFTITDSTKVDFMDKSFHFPGKVTWEPVTIKFVDSKEINVSKRSYTYLTNAGWLSPGDQNFKPAALSAVAGLKTIGKAGATTNTGTVVVKVLGADGDTIDTWTLNNAFITKATFNDLSYASEEILTVEYTFRYDWADLT
jgi:hypothetical protein